MTEIRDQWSILAESIGQYSADMIGRDHVDALSVVLDSRTQSCTVSVELHKSTREEQLRAMRILLDVEGVFLDEVTMSFDFVEDINNSGPVLESQRQFQAV